MPDKAKAYFNELLEGQTGPVDFLWCFFATLPDPVEKRFEEYVDRYESILPTKLNFTHVCATLDDYEEQLEKADVVYIHGGSVEPLIEVFGKHKLTDLFAGKSIGFTSASTIMMATHGWSCDSRQMIDGLGIVPMKVGVHFRSLYGSDDPRGPIDWDVAKAELDAYGDTTLPVHALEEGEFIVIEQ